jgi:hypothetical protein
VDAVIEFASVSKRVEGFKAFILEGDITTRSDFDVHIVGP